MFIPVVSAEDLTVITLKAWDGLGDRGFFLRDTYEEEEEREFRLDIMHSEIASINADLIVLNGLNGLPASAEELSEELGYQGLYSVNRGGFRIGVVGFPWNLREGDVVLARPELSFAPIEPKRFSGLFIKNTLSAGNAAAPQIMGGKISLSGREVYVFSVHWSGVSGDPEGELRDLTDRYMSRDLNGKEFIKEIGNAVEMNEAGLALVFSTLGFINSMAGESPVILLGSFNVPPDSREIAALKEAGFTDAWKAGSGPGYTLDGRRNSNIRRFYEKEDIDRQERLDYVFYRGNGLTLRAVKLAFDSPTFGVHPSDRFGVYARFSVSPVSE